MSDLRRTLDPMTREPDRRVRSWWETAAAEQPLLNAVTPSADPAAAPNPPGPIPVIARLHWETDGVELRDTVALAWTRTDVCIRLLDHRWRTTAAWIPASDVTRRAHLVSRGQHEWTGEPLERYWVLDDPGPDDGQQAT